MKKISLHTKIFFVLALIPAVIFLLLCVFYGDIYEIFGVLIWVIMDGGWVLLPVVVSVVGFQVSAIVNYVDAYRQVKSWSYQRYNENKIPLLTVKFFYFSIAMTLILVIGFVLLLFYGISVLYLILLAPVFLFVQIAGVVGYIDARKEINEHKDNQSDKNITQ